MCVCVRVCTEYVCGDAVRGVGSFVLRVTLPAVKLIAHDLAHWLGIFVPHTHPAQELLPVHTCDYATDPVKLQIHCMYPCVYHVLLPLYLPVLVNTSITKTVNDSVLCTLETAGQWESAMFG